MRTPTRSVRRNETEVPVLASFLWALAALAWVVMAILFIRHGLFAAACLLLIALICLPGLRAAFGVETGARIHRVVATSAVLVLAVGCVLSAA